MSEFDVNWPHGHQTRDGRPARIICTDKNDPDFPIGGLVFDQNTGKETFFGYTKNGTLKLPIHNSYDLVNKPAPMPVRWVAFISSGSVIDYDSAEEAEEDHELSRHRTNSEILALRRLTVRDGKIVDVTDEQV